MTYHAKRTKGAAGAKLFLTFHGTGGTEDQFHGFAEQLIPGAHVTSPRGDVSEHGAARYFRRTAEGVYDMDDLALRSRAMADFITAEQQAVKPPRTIGLGYSNGANILAAVAMRDAVLVDDLILMHPLIPFTPAPQPRLRGRRVLITAGENDPICPSDLTQALASYLTAQGADVQLHWHPGGHGIAQSEVTAVQNFLTA
ncbi:alpha/beta hydrolase [Yoonia vestfoldensis]|uniref:Putative hydrolase MhqD n=1 Tax=Yoonia vestfoldensis TaxID=245188 RepID=A0A1Y0EHF5_9RHOB|nr:alpha/beta hydrolase [Yoonia vestfoldensis]ARU03035.1 putative hydrolase MhqD [Yoonia vestfoldensis]